MVFGSHVSYEVFQDSDFLEKLNPFKEDISFAIAVRENHKTMTPQRVHLDKNEVLAHKFESDPQQEKHFYKLLDFNMARNRKRSEAFRHRLNRRILGKFKMKSMGGTRYLSYISQQLRRKDNVLLLTAFIPAVSSVVFSILKRRYPFPVEFFRLCEKLKPDLIILMTNGAEPCIYEVPLVAQKLKLPWHLIVDNWDNLSSKSVFWENPDHIYVWGSQHEDFAKSIHGIESVNVTKIGTPRITFPGNVPSLTSARRPMVVYVGQQEPYDELSDLRYLAGFCSIQKLELVFRPHPLRRFTNQDKRQLNEMIDKGNLILNISENFTLMQDQWPSNLKLWNSISKLNKEELLSCNPTCVIGPPTSLILESLIYRNPTVIIARDDKQHRTTASMYWDSYPHFRVFKEIKSIKVARSHSEMELKVKECMSGEVSFIGIIDAIRYICGEGSENWSRNLITQLLVLSDSQHEG